MRPEDESQESKRPGDDDDDDDDEDDLGWVKKIIKEEVRTNVLFVI